MGTPRFNKKADYKLRNQYVKTYNDYLREAGYVLVNEGKYGLIARFKGRLLAKKT